MNEQNHRKIFRIDSNWESQIRIQRKPVTALDDDRPHLGRGLVWLPQVEHWRLTRLARLVVPYHSSATIDEGIAVTREVLRATLDLARARGAAPLILVPQLHPESAMERVLRQRILDEGALPYVFVEIDPVWNVPGDTHPNARAARVLAKAVAEKLLPEGLR